MNKYDDYEQWNEPSTQNTTNNTDQNFVIQDSTSETIGQDKEAAGFNTAPATPYPVMSAPSRGTKSQKSFSAGLIVALCVCCVFSLLLGTVGGALISTGYMRRLEKEQGAALEEIRAEQQSVLESIAAETEKHANSTQNNTGTVTPLPSTGTQLSVKDVAARVQDSVVAINVSVTQSVTGFGQTEEYTSISSGSGVIISSDGYVVTNNHVIEGGETATVILRDGTEYTADLVGTDDVFDIAVLKIEATGLTAATFGSSDSVEIGETSIVIGNPLGEFGNSVTSGVISGLDREITVDDETMILIQTDAAVNPGNSGGGMFNAQGELIGVIVAKSTGNDVEGLGFAIPIDDVSKVVSDLIEYGYVTGRPKLGIEIVEINNAMTAMRYGVNRLGVYVTNVENDSTAYEAGLRIGDCLISIDDEEFTTYLTMIQLLPRDNVGGVLSVVVQRYGENGTETLQVPLIEQVPETFQSSAAA